MDDRTEHRTAYQRAYRARNGGRLPSERAWSIATGAAAQYVRRRFPRVWDGLLDDAYARIGHTRRKYRSRR